MQTIREMIRLVEMSEAETTAHNLLFDIRQRLDLFDQELRRNANRSYFQRLSGKNRREAVKALSKAYELVADIGTYVEDGTITPENFVAFMEDEREDAVYDYQWNPNDQAATHYKLRNLKSILLTLAKLLSRDRP